LGAPRRPREFANRTPFPRFVLSLTEPIMDKTKIRAFADKVYADRPGAMTAGMAIC